MNMSFLILDDMAALRRGYNHKLIKCGEGQNITIKTVECENWDEAIFQFESNAFDGIITDINLKGEDDKFDRGGLAFARYVKNRNVNAYLFGISGVFEDREFLSEDKNLFDISWDKSRHNHDLDKNFEEAIKTLTQRKLDQQSKNEIHTPESEAEYLQGGYKEYIVEATDTNRLRSPFAVWCKDSNEGVELIVMGCRTLHSWGDTFEEAQTGLIELVSSYEDTFELDAEELSSGMLEAREFARRVLDLTQGAGA